MPSLLVTNDFPPKHGGIQSYLYELWRRLPPADTTVLTTAFPHADAWDRDQPFRIERVRSRVLWPTRRLRDRIDAMAARSAGGRRVPRPDDPARAARAAPRRAAVRRRRARRRDHRLRPCAGVAPVRASRAAGRGRHRRRRDVSGARGGAGGRGAIAGRRHPARRRRRTVPSGRRRDPEADACAVRPRPGSSAGARVVAAGSPQRLRRGHRRV